MIFCSNMTCTSRSWSQIMWNIWALEATYDFKKKAWIVYIDPLPGSLSGTAAPSSLRPDDPHPPPFYEQSAASKRANSQPHTRITSLRNGWHSALWSPRPFLMSTRSEKWTRGAGSPSVIWKEEKQTCPLMLRSGWGRFIFARVLFPNQLVKLQCTALFVNGADNRGCLADRPLHLPPDGAARLETLPGSPPHVHVLSRWLGAHQITCHFDIRANISPLLYFRSIRRANVGNTFTHSSALMVCDAFSTLDHTPYVWLSLCILKH